MQSLTQQAKEVLSLSLVRNLNYDTLNVYQREQLTAAAITDLGSSAHEVVDNVIVSPAFINKLKEAVEENNFADKNVLMKELGEMLVNGAKEYCKENIVEALDVAFSQLAVKSQFYGESEIEQDTRQRSRDLNIYQHAGV